MSKTIMIVDDSRVSRMMIKAIVQQRHPDWAIQEADNGASALECAQEASIDFFSVDYNMPGDDGLTVIEKLRAQHADSRFALLTANIQEAVRSRAYELQVLCVNKPITETSVGEILEYFADE
ncbi:response regulator [Ectothiorhodospiraceae bacterium BW-2]|nr:response regulator [Ectothiorhodospiraceae bacterium BW-2]